MNNLNVKLAVFTLLSFLTALPLVVRAGDPYVFYTWKVTYGSRDYFGGKQQVILINDMFPGPMINGSSNNNIVVNVFNNIDEPLLFTWNGIQQRKNSWQEGMLGTNCPIAPGTNYTYQFQVKDQIGSYFYYPSTSTHRAAGGYGLIRVYSRLLIPVPFPDPEDDYSVLAGDWYKDDHKTLKRVLDEGRTLARPDGILINGVAGSLNGTTKGKPMFTFKKGKVYRFRMCNVGLKYSLNFRIQGHSMKLVEMEGSHTVQNVYTSLDVHLGQCLSVLVTADQEPRDYHLVASSRFTKHDLVASAIISYEGSQGEATVPIPPSPVGWAWSLNQFQSFRWNLTASAARPNPQGSYHYGQINITRTIKMVNDAGQVDDKLRYSVNTISHSNPETPLKLAEYFGVADKVFEYNVMKDTPPSQTDKTITAPNVVNITYRTFVEIIFENPEKSVQSWHLSGYSFFPVGMAPGTWTPEKRKNYNLVDAVSRNTIQVYPKSWSAIMLTFDNAGMWSLRSVAMEKQYLGQEVYLSVLSPERSLRDEYNIPNSTLLCGLVKGLPKPTPYT